MINQKYYKDIKNLSKQFQEGTLLTQEFKIRKNPEKIVLCGVGGSSLYVDLINDFLESESIDIKIEACRSYNLPNNVNNNTFFFVVSHSGNTEETLSCLDEITKKNYEFLIITSGGELQKISEENVYNHIIIPNYTQPRLSTGYFISVILSVFVNSKLIPQSVLDKIFTAATKLDNNLEEDKAKELAEKLLNKVPIIYSTSENYSIAQISKIKFNENSKVQAFCNYFPELNHNEMVGFTHLVMKPYFIIFRSQFTHSRNLRRVEVFTDLMKYKDLGIDIIDLKGENLIEEILNAYYFIDHVTYYLAENYNIDPEPVDMVNDFKKMLKEG